MDRPFVEANESERTRLRDLVSSLTDQQLLLRLPSGWPIYVALAHLAFWDQRSAILIRKWKEHGITQSPVDPQVINDALAPFFQAMPPRHAADFAVQSAETIDTLLAEAPDDLIAGITALGDRFRLYRCDHRRLHLDKIEKVLRA